MTTRALSLWPLLLALLALGLTLGLGRAPAATCPYSGATLQSGQALGPGPAWRGVRPAGQNEVFATADGCALCHSSAPRAVAMRSATGDDVSPYALWQGTAMANSFHDPFWRAQMAREVSLAPDQQRAIESSCITCHAPMAHHSARLAELPPPTFAEIQHDALARDGVSCTVCHQAGPEGLGTPHSFGGNLSIEKGRRIFGPHADPVEGPMLQHASYTPVFGEHISQSAFCGSCHTLIAEHGGKPFPEQTPYLEWRNSSFTTEAGFNPEGTSCQDCHMPEVGDTKIARNPAGRDFNLPVREDFSAHAFVGGNAFLLDMLRENAEELGVTAPAEAFERMAHATRRQLAEQTTRVAIGDLRTEEGRLRFHVRVENLTGHKFPTGYPARRAWLEVDVRVGNRVAFASGRSDARGRISGVADERNLPHVQTVTSADQVQVWEMVAVDAEGRAVTDLTRMYERSKDNRLLPRGWSPDGPHVAETAPVGTEGDPDFLAGEDTVHFDLDLGPIEETVRVVAWVRYQPIPPTWVEPLRAVDHDHARQFVRMYDAADPRPETAGLAIEVLRP